MYPDFVTCNDAIHKILAFPVKMLLQPSVAFNSSVLVKSRKLFWYPVCANFSKMQMFVNDCVHRSHRKIHLLCNFTTGHASIIQDQAFHALNVHRNECCGLGTTMAGIVTDRHVAIFETYTSFKCLPAAECLITILCLKSSVDIRGFYTFVHKKLHHHTLFHACTTATCAPPISNRTHLSLTTACSTTMLASLFIPVKLKVLV